MRRFAAQDAADRDQRVIVTCAGEFFRGQRQLKRARDTHYVHVFAGGSCALQSVNRSSEQAVSNKTVEAAHNNSKAQTRSGEFAIDRPGLEFFRHRGLAICL